MLVLRHGETTWNAEKRWQGRADSPLSALGVAQARFAGEALGASDAFDVVVTSNLSRARTTGTLIAEALGVPLTIEADLAERDVGVWSGLTFDEIEAGWPGALAAGEHPEGWEPDEEVADRAVDALRWIAKDNPGGRVLIISHGGLIRSVERSLGVESPHLANLGGLWLTLDGDEITAGERVELIDHAAVAATVPDSE
jgi:2,3-bisphosphoglycerate-dependent phosphoglycerate mutase